MELVNLNGEEIDVGSTVMDILGGISALMVRPLLYAYYILLGGQQKL
jgi:hypothetical protein